jgi:nicotinate-nucleotide pyrophosphorylase (carboxylating)
VGEAVSSGATLVLCDNMTPEQVKEAVLIASQRGVGAPLSLIEASGGVSLENVAAYAAAGADLISVGALTHSAPILDIGLDLA